MSIPLWLAGCGHGHTICNHPHGERWAWPESHPSHGRDVPDACEIGYTWLSRSALRTAANTEAKLLMLRHAFEVWQVLRVLFHTDVRNQWSRAALEPSAPNSRAFCVPIEWRQTSSRGTRFDIQS